MAIGTQIEPLVQHIREALWRSPGRGLATVMVGAGFSRNAEPAYPDARQFPLWHHLANDMAKGIGLEGDHKPRDPLLIAQMYAAMRGTTDLHRLIERSVPDMERKPGDLHRRLLSLPWADVFTTNYDTLLERSCREVHDRRYELVLSPRDLPMKQAQRLVKLHGTLGSGGQLVATQEDYRQYPVTHAPFVNLVRQSVMETVFVLIGFTGEDPNFLEWTGWVRDVLGDHAPKIYLCGLLNSSPAAKALLDSRRVTQIDLTEVVIGVDESQRHAKALDWLIAALESGRPGRALGWAPVEPYPMPVRVPALPHVKVFTPLSEIPAARTLEETDTPKLLLALKIWQAQREEYPGWHVAPDSIRDRVWSGMKEWRQVVFDFGEKLNPADRLRLAHELCWRLELCLSPIFTPETDKLVVWLEAINPFGAALDLPSATRPEAAEISELGKNWQAVALHVLRTSREDLDETRYQCWRTRLLTIGADNSTLFSELQHEDVLLQLNRLDFAAFRAGLKNWRTTARQPLELARLAALYAELGDVSTTRELGIAAVNAARAGGKTNAAISLEAWSCVLLRLLDWQDAARVAEWRERVDLAKDQGYDPWAILDKMRDELKRAHRDRQKSSDDESGFDAGDIRRSVKLYSEDSALLGYRLLRLIEKAPCPLRVLNSELCAEAAAHAAILVGDAAPFWSLAMLLRSGANEKMLHKIFDRASVAAMEVNRVTQLYQQLVRVADKEVTRLTMPAEPDWLAANVLPTTLDILSRISLRLPSKELFELRDRTVSWLSSSVFIEHYLLHEPLGWMMQRVIEALPDEEIVGATISFLRVPMLGESACQPRHDFHWPDPFDRESLGGRRASALKTKPEDWQVIWARLMSGLRQELSSKLRERAFMRVYMLDEWGWLTNQERQAFAEAAWTRVDPVTNLPSFRGILDTAVLYFLCPPNIDVATLVRCRLLGEEPKQWQRGKDGWSTGLSSDFREWAYKTACTMAHPAFAEEGNKLLALDVAEAEALARRLLLWWPSAKPVLLNPRFRRIGLGSFNQDEVLENFCIVAGQVVIPRLLADHPLLGEFESVLLEIERNGFSVARARIGWLALRPDLLGVLVSEFEVSLLSRDQKNVRRAARAITVWRRAAKLAFVPSVPIELLWSLTARVATRQMASFDSVTNCLAGFVESDELPCELENRLMPALEHLADETAAQILRERYLRAELERSAVAEGLHVRAWAGLLAGKLGESILRRSETLPSVLVRWREICGKDPLPEIRRAWQSSE